MGVGDGLVWVIVVVVVFFFFCCDQCLKEEVGMVEVGCGSWLGRWSWLGPVVGSGGWVVFGLWLK